MATFTTKFDVESQVWVKCFDDEVRHLTIESISIEWDGAKQWVMYGFGEGHLMESEQRCFGTKEAAIQYDTTPLDEVIELIFVDGGGIERRKVVPIFFVPEKDWTEPSLFIEYAKCHFKGKIGRFLDEKIYLIVYTDTMELPYWCANGQAHWMLKNDSFTYQLAGKNAKKIC